VLAEHREKNIPILSASGMLSSPVLRPSRTAERPETVACCARYRAARVSKWY
jgi:hypothetical protein